MAGASSSPDADPASVFLGRDSQSIEHAGLNTTSSCLRSQFWASVSEHHEEPIRHDLQEEYIESPHKQVRASTLRLHTLESRSRAQVMMSENECAVLLSARLVCIRVLASVCHCGDMKKPCPTCAMRSMVKSISLGPRRSSGFKIKPTVIEVENDNSVEIFAHLPIGTVIAFSEETLVDSEVTGEFSKPLVNDSKSALDTGMVWQKPFDDWTNYLPYLNATGDEPEILADRKHDFCNLGLELSRFRAKKNLKSDCPMDDGEVNGQVAMCNSPLEIPYGDISYQNAKRRGNIPYLDHQVTRRHAMCMNITAIAAKILADGIISSYPCTDPMLNPKDGFNSHTAAYSCNEFIINNIQVDVNILTNIPEAWLASLLFDFVGWYRPYNNQQMLQSSSEKPKANTYLPREPISIARNATTEIKPRSQAPTEINSKWNGNPYRNLTMGKGDLLMLMAVPNKSECHDDEVTGDKDVGHSHHCVHIIEHWQIIDCGRRNEIMYHQKT